MTTTMVRTYTKVEQLAPVLLEVSGTQEKDRSSKNKKQRSKEI